MRCSKENVSCRRLQIVLHGRTMEVVSTIPDNFEGADIPWRVESFGSLRIESFGMPVTV